LVLPESPGVFEPRPLTARGFYRYGGLRGQRGIVQTFQIGFCLRANHPGSSTTPPALGSCRVAGEAGMAEPWGAGGLDGVREPGIQAGVLERLQTDKMMKEQTG